MKNFFKSRKKREKEARRERRKAFRQAENSVDAVKDRIKEMEKDAATSWDKARQARKSGEKAAAKRHLISYRAAQTLMMKQEQKRWVFEQYLMKMDAAQTDNEFSDALAKVNKVVNIDPERVEDVFDASQDLLGEQVDAEKFWNNMYEKEMEGASGELEDHVPSMEELVNQLEDETVAELGSPQKEQKQEENHDTEQTQQAQNLENRISEGQQRVKDLLDTEKNDSS